ncbi:MAG: hypothetical protein CL840_16530 [Crocinitomicaceae bacterium]|nr:hypothetical protein [Crocinitomicaceae bacterium]|tara:strand:+ start:1884 stop:2543 length:660 start_codon:yes stop_codon:yes gene_type:complete
MKTINIGVVDDHNLIREGIRELLKDSNDIKIIFEVSDGVLLLRELEKRKIKPHILILDLEMPGMNGFEVTKFLKANYPEIRLIILTMHTSEEVIINMLKSGASSYLDKNTSHEELERAIRGVHKTGYYYNERISTTLARNLNKRKRYDKHSTNAEFTDLEISVIELVYKEMTNSQIADIVCRSKGTIEAIKRNIFRKAGVKSSTGIVKYAIKNNIVGLD